MYLIINTMCVKDTHKYLKNSNDLIQLQYKSRLVLRPTKIKAFIFNLHYNDDKR